MKNIYIVKFYFSSLISSLYFNSEIEVVAESESEARINARESFRKADLVNHSNYVSIYAIERKEDVSNYPMEKVEIY
jgi:hypothetical protein